ncbi:MAG: maleylpyruvate isomerase N-terminal domain-containing protein [Anaerolineae bacterium]|nr:MAG: hypothetical protein F9K27_12535 [Anaerolineae bacterium]MCL4880076.1 maleylpyruvate isomerase N-terminal domain-containing protein [Anaerolineae bacterium]
MNTVDILKNGHLTVLRTVDGLPDHTWEMGGVCGVWSVKDILAHLASFEHVLEDLLNHLLDNSAATPTLNRMIETGDDFNDLEVARYNGQSSADIWRDYRVTCEKTLTLAEKIPAEQWRQNGVLPWYGEIYDLDDFIVYTFYGHKREHCAQINVFKDSLKGR